MTAVNRPSGPDGTDYRSGSGTLQLKSLTKRFGDSTAVSAIDLEIEPGEFFCLLGASGCGKTTTLRMIAGLETPTSGTITLDGENITSVPPHRRNVNTVFQNYALFPHLSVEDNIRFGLQFRRGRGREGSAEVARMLALVRMEGYEHRRPDQLSGGQQQRVALARALILRPALLLLDEPLGALDAQLRDALQVELKSIQEQLGISFVYVTHDQGEAMRMADRLAVMSEGQIMQVGEPEKVYSEPRNSFVAAFLGAANIFTAQVVGSGPDETRVAVGAARLLAAESAGVEPGSSISLAIRPESVRLSSADEHRTNLVDAVVERIAFAGASVELHARLDGGSRILAALDRTQLARGLRPGVGERVVLHLPADELRLLPDG